MNPTIAKKMRQQIESRRIINRPTPFRPNDDVRETVEYVLFLLEILTYELEEKPKRRQAAKRGKGK